MSNTWLTVFSVLFSSTLVVEIFRLVVGGIKAYKDKKNNVKKLPDQVAAMVVTLDSMNKKLDNDASHFKRVDTQLKELTEAVNYNAEGTELGLKNDKIIFSALRDNHINGESEQAEKEIDAYILRSVRKHLTVAVRPAK